MSTSYYEEKISRNPLIARLGRILSLIVPHIRWTVGSRARHLVVSARAHEAGLSHSSARRIVDEGSLRKNDRFLPDPHHYMDPDHCSGIVGVFVFIYLASTLGERIRYDLRRRMFNISKSFAFQLQPHR